jgi:EAL domain-containing protein (putative c-di-GMP-specific phosphodiesterase class I)
LFRERHDIPADPLPQTWTGRPPPAEAGIAAPRGRVLVLARDPALVAAARAAAMELGRDATLLRSGREALALLAAPGSRGPRHLICDPSSAGAAWPDMLAMVAEARDGIALVVVSATSGPVPPGILPVPADPIRLAAALRALPAPPAPMPQDATAALRRGLDRGEIAVRYQPIIRIADRRPVMVEALARWQPRYPPIRPDRFVPMAERAGLLQALSATVAARALAEVAPLRRILPAGVTINLPMEIVVQPDLAAWLRRAIGRSGMRATDVAVELTEAETVPDRAALDRALRRLRDAGHRVLLDDLVADDPRQGLLDLPFAGIKLDRSLVAALPGSARARQQVRRLARRAAARDQVLVAEGVAGAELLGVLGDLGVGLAQGFLIGRPLPAAALPAWSESWRARRPR